MDKYFEKKDGYFIIKVDDNTYFMRSHPRDMYSSMKAQKHDRFLAYKKPQERSLQIHFSDNEIVLTIEQLKKFIESEG